MTEVAAEHSVLAPDGTRLHVALHGRGEPVLLIQGLGYATWAWAPLIDGLRDRLRLVAFDNRGSGRSDKPPGPYTISLLAEDAMAVLEQTGLPSAHVVGASMGGYIAQTLAVRHPHAVRSLVLIATSPGGKDARGVPEETLRAWRSAAGSSAAEFARRTMPLSFAPGWTTEHPSEFEQLLQARLRYPTPPDAWRAQFDASEAFLRDGLGPHPIHQPVLAVHGTEDRVVPYDNLTLLAHQTPHVRVAPLESAGHLCWIERASEVSRLIDDFVADVSKS